MPVNGAVTGEEIQAFSNAPATSAPIYQFIDFEPDPATGWYFMRARVYGQHELATPRCFCQGGLSIGCLAPNYILAAARASNLRRRLRSANAALTSGYQLGYTLLLGLAGRAFRVIWHLKRVFDPMGKSAISAYCKHVKKRHGKRMVSLLCVIDFAGSAAVRCNKKTRPPAKSGGRVFLLKAKWRETI